MRLAIQISILGVLLLSAKADVYDSVVAAVGMHAIKSSDIERDIRLTAFLNGVQPEFAPADKRKAADRLIDQAIIRDEMTKAKVGALSANADSVLNRIKTVRFHSEAEYRQALERSHISEAELKTHISLQIAVVAFVDVRFGPQRDGGVPAKNASALAQSEERANEAFFKWLDESRKKVRIQYRGELAQ